MKITDKIDHTILRADARAVEVRRYCSEAVEIASSVLPARISRCSFKNAALTFIPLLVL